MVGNGIGRTITYQVLLKELFMEKRQIIHIGRKRMNNLFLNNFGNKITVTIKRSK